MKFIKFVLVTFLVVGGASLNALESPSETYRFFREFNQKINEVNFSHATNLSKNITQLKKLTELNNELTKYTVYLGKHLKVIIKDETSISGLHIETLFNIVDSFRSVLIQNNKLTSTYITYLPKTNLSTHKALKPEVLIWVAAHLNIIKSYHYIHHVFYKDTNLRRILKNVLSTAVKRKYALKDLIPLLYQSINKDNQKLVFNLREIVKSQSSDAVPLFLRQRINRPSFDNILDGRGYIDYSYSLTTDFLIDIMEGFTFSASKLFGTIIGNIKWRKGYFWQNKKALDYFEKKLKPLDIISDKTPFSMSDTTIPGYFTHTALWLGTKKQLQEIGMWDDPIIRPYQKLIEQGRYILESIRPGVQINSLMTFSNIDEMLISRREGILDNPEEVRETYRRALIHYGKSYDFNFDTETVGTIVCSELLFMAMGDIKWPTDKILGRHTINPDHVAELMYYEKSPIKFVDMIGVDKDNNIYHVSKDKLAKLMGFSKSGESYQKSHQECETVSWDNFQLGSIPGRRLNVNLCKTVAKPAIYEPYEVIDLDF